MDLAERFLRYSLEHARPIELFCQTEDGIRRLRAVITDIGPDTVHCLPGARKKLMCIARASILSAGYTRGDDGEGPRAASAKKETTHP